MRRGGGELNVRHRPAGASRVAAHDAVLYLRDLEFKTLLLGALLLLLGDLALSSAEDFRDSVATEEQNEIKHNGNCDEGGCHFHHFLSGNVPLTARGR